MVDDCHFIETLYTTACCNRFDVPLSFSAKVPLTITMRVPFYSELICNTSCNTVRHTTCVGAPKIGNDPNGDKKNNNAGKNLSQTLFSSIIQIHTDPIPPFYGTSTFILHAKMASYPIDISPLQPFASGVAENQATPILQGVHLDDNRVIAASAQHQKRNLLLQCDPPLLTQVEVLASMRRKQKVESANSLGEGVPIWAQTMQQQMVDLQQQMVSVQQQFQQNFQHISREIQRESQRSINRSRKSIEMVVRVDDGQMPSEQDPPIWFPTNYDDLMAATGDELSALLQFYGQDCNETMLARKARLKHFLGVTL
jgi:hypothetical protein